MRGLRWLFLTASLAAVVAAFVTVSCAPRSQQTAAAPTAADSVAHGRYLVTLMSCGDCHTPGGMYGAPDTTRTLSGSELGWGGPWGVSYPRNLTPDMETGIGSWTAEQIVTAIRTGQRPDGTRLNPPMPWPNYGGMKDADAYAIAAYLKSLPAVSHKVPALVPPGKPVKGAVVNVPPPPKWDAPPAPPAGT
jgi:mono/diheme cytochrome c family protein